MQLDRQPRSGLATVKRDFSSNNMTDTSPASALPATATATKRSTLSDSLRKAIQDGISSREADDKASIALSASQKRPLSPGAVSLPKKHQLPSSWGDFGSSSQSLVYFRSRSSTTSALPDMSLHGHQEETEFPWVPSSERKPAHQPAEISLSDEQKNILELVLQGKNVFYTGSAGVYGIP